MKDQIAKRILAIENDIKNVQDANQMLLGAVMNNNLVMARKEETLKELKALLTEPEKPESDA